MYIAQVGFFGLDISDADIASNRPMHSMQVVEFLKEWVEKSPK